jgi:hypothetical protein
VRSPDPLLFDDHIMLRPFAAKDVLVVAYARADLEIQRWLGEVVALTHLRTAIATLELSLGDPGGAWQVLERSAQTSGAGEHFLLVRVLPYAIEALVELGRSEEAAALADGLEAAEGILARWRGPALRARALGERRDLIRDPVLNVFRSLLGVLDEGGVWLRRDSPE